METGKYFHIYNHANGSEKLFIEEENYRWFLERYTHFINPVADTLAYCLMPNHFHFLIQVKRPSLLKTFPKSETLEKPDRSPMPAKMFSNLFSSYTQAFNKRYNRKGSLFMKNFKRKEINSDNYLTNVLLYIHLNPVLHGFTDSAEQWSWSSYGDMLNDSNPWLAKEPVLNWFGGREQFVTIHRKKTITDLMEIDDHSRWFSNPG